MTGQHAHTVPSGVWTVIGGTGLEVFQATGQTQTVIVIGRGIIFPRPVAGWAVKVVKP